MRGREFGAVDVSARSEVGATGELARRWDAIRAEAMPYEEPSGTVFVNRVALEGDDARNFGYENGKRRMSDTTEFE